MSILANKTEEAAIKILTRCLKYFDELSDLQMTADDAFTIRSAENQIKSVIENNGFVIAYKSGKYCLKKL